MLLYEWYLKIPLFILTMICRICLEDDTLDNQFINPCLCNGTSKWVHLACLQKWRYMNLHRPAFQKCMECDYAYRLQKKYPLENFSPNCGNNKVCTYICCSAILTFFFSIFIKSYDQHQQSLYLISWGNTYLYQRLNQSFTDTNQVLYYQSLSTTIYANLFLVIFFLLAIYRIQRKKLYLQLVGKKFLLQFLQINNMLYMFTLMLLLNVIDTYIPINCVISIYTLFLTYQIVDISNTYVYYINNYHNPGLVLPYPEEITDETINIII